MFSLPPAGSRGNRHSDHYDRKMKQVRLWVALFAASTYIIAPAAAQVETGRAAALDYIGRGTAAFRNGDIIAATRHWSEAIRLCRANGAADLEAQALARRGEAYR